MSRRCWICGDEATTGEHKTKRSDLRDVLGTPTQEHPFFFSDGNKMNRPVGSLNSPILKIGKVICAPCNNSRTQPYDRAWEAMSRALRRRHPALRAGEIVRANRIFKYGTASQMRNVQLYFVKLLGCYVAEEDIDIDLSIFAASILQEKAHPNIYLRFGLFPDGFVGSSDLNILRRADDGVCAFMTWFYEVGGVAVNVVYAVAGEQREGLKGAWHPRMGTNKLLIADFS